METKHDSKPKMSYQVINHLDCQGRFNGVDFYLNGKVGQDDSHCICYLQAREQLKEFLGESMGLDKIVEESS